MEGIHIDERDTNITVDYSFSSYFRTECNCRRSRKSGASPILKEKNVKLVQGYYYSRPLSKHDMENVYYNIIDRKVMC